MELTTSLIPFIYPQVFDPVLTEMGTTAANTMQNKLLAAEKLSPGICLELVMGILKKSDISCNVHETILRAHGVQNEDTNFNSQNPPVRLLVRELGQLKKILSRIPDQIYGDRKTFLMTIKETAGTIKGILGTMADVSRMLPNPSTRSLLDLQKMDFVKYSKRFSMTLQDYFRDGMERQVYVSALFIINQANVIILTMKQL